MQLLVVFLMLILNLFINAIYWEHRGTNKLRLKMKTFRLIGMALLAVVMCVNFTSCSDDDDPIKNDDGIITNQKKLMEIKETSDDGYISIYTFSYDNQSRLTSIVDNEDGHSDNNIINFTWGNNTIIATKRGDARRTYTLSDNLVRKQQNNEGASKAFTYNSSNQLIKVDETDERHSGDDCSYTYTWDNGKMIKHIYKENNSEKSYVYEYTYNGKTCKGWFPNMEDEGWDALDDDYIFFAHPELVGMRTNQLPEQIFSKDTEIYEYYDEYFKETCKSEYTYEDTVKFEYKLDKDGYVESCTVTYTYVNTTKQSFTDKNGDGVITDDERNVTETRTETDITIYSFKWE